MSLTLAVILAQGHVTLLPSGHESEIKIQLIRPFIMVLLLYLRL
jgi:hypothetical protein